MQKIFPKKLSQGDKIAVIAPAQSMHIIGKESRQLANQRFKQLGLDLLFGEHIEEMDDFVSTSINSRVEDLHNAFADKSVKGIISVIGGFNSIQLLEYLDWGLIKNNPKVFCGFSDITVLNNAVYAKTGLVNYSGPHYSTFGQKLFLDYTVDYFKKCLFGEQPFQVIPSSEWTDDRWWLNQDDRHPQANEGFLVINEGEAQGTILGANLCTLNLLQGTEYFPDLASSILFLEDDSQSDAVTFDRDLQSLMLQPAFSKVKGIVIGRFQRDSKMTDELLKKIIATRPKLDKIPVVANADFGHTDPKITFPIGGTVNISVANKKVKIEINAH